MDRDRSAIAHLYRRAGFGARPGQLDDAVAAGYDATVDRLCDLTLPDPAADAIAPPAFDTPALLAGLRSGDQAATRRARALARADTVAAMVWWLRRMVAAEQPLREKLTWFWHGHFATSIQKVRIPELMYAQNATLRRLGSGSFEALAASVVHDPAMLLWLDGTKNRKGSPNENLARELLELFVLGHGHEGHQPYGEDDVAAAARSLTGLRIDRRGGGASIDPRRHDAGTKTFLGETGAWGPDDVVRIASGHPASAPFVVSRLWSRLGRPAMPDEAPVAELAAAFSAADLDIASLCRRLFRHPEFLGAATRTGLVKSPVEWAVGCIRALGLGPEAVDERLLRGLAGLGQLPLRPPSVAGWPENEAWLTTGAALGRLEMADALAAAADRGALERTGRAARPEAVARLLGVEAWGPATAGALAKAADDPHALLTLALVAPENLLA